MKRRFLAAAGLVEVLATSGCAFIPTLVVHEDKHLHHHYHYAPDAPPPPLPHESEELPDPQGCEPDCDPLHEPYSPDPEPFPIETLEV